MPMEQEDFGDVSTGKSLVVSDLFTVLTFLLAGLRNPTSTHQYRQTSKQGLYLLDLCNGSQVQPYPVQAVSGP